MFASCWYLKEKCKEKNETSEEVILKFYQMLFIFHIIINILWIIAILFVYLLEGQLRHIKTGEPFVFNYQEDLHRWNQKRYEALGEVWSYIKLHTLFFFFFQFWRVRIKVLKLRQLMKSFVKKNFKNYWFFLFVYFNGYVWNIFSRFMFLCKPVLPMTLIFCSESLHQKTNSWWILSFKCF